MDPCFGGGDPHLLEQRDRPFQGILGLHVAVRLDRLLDLKAHLEDRIQAAERVLKDHRDVLAANVADLLAAHLQQVIAAEQDLAAHDPARFVDQAQDGQGGHALAAARLADDPERFPGGQVKTDAVDRLDHAVVGEELGAQIF